MNRWRWVGCIVLVSAVALGVTANAEPGGSGRPEWKGFADNKPFWQEMTTDTTQTMKVQGQEVVQKQTQTFWVKWTPLKQVGKGWEAEYEIVAVKMDIQIGGNNISYNSMAKEPPPQNPLTDFFKTLVGSKFKLTIAEDKDKGNALRVTSVDKGDLDKFVEKLAAANEQLKPLLKNILSADAIKDMSNPTFDAFPKNDEEFKKGEWASNIKLNMGPIGTYDTNYKYTLEKGSKDKINVEATMTYAPPAKGADSASLPFTIKSGNLKAEPPAKGQITLDSKGNIGSSKMEMDVKGQLTIDIAGMETVVDLNQKQVSTLTTKYEDPVGTKK